MGRVGESLVVSICGVIVFLGTFAMARIAANARNERVTWNAIAQAGIITFVAVMFLQVLFDSM